MTTVQMRDLAYEVGWNGRPRTLTLPRDHVAHELAMTDLPALPDVAAAILRAVEEPIGAPPLSEQVRPGMKVALLTGDRITDVMLGRREGVGMPLLDHLNRLGIRDEDITLIHAGGSHPNPDWQARFGESLLGRVHAIRHDAWDEPNLRYLGITSRSTPVWINRIVAEADFTLAIGEISPTVHGGWCGGGKIILPGVAGMDTIEQNHHYMMRPLNTLGLVETNHMRQDMDEGARLANLQMKVDVLINSRAEIVHVSAGDLVKEHRAALPLARQIWMTRMEPVDIFVIYPGEAHEEYLCWSMWIRLEGADLGLKEGGIIILAQSAAGGWAPAERIAQHQATPAEAFTMDTEAMARAMARKHGNMRNVSMNFSARRVLEKRRTFLVCDGIAPDEARAFGFAHCTTDFDAALRQALAERGPGATIAANIQHGVGWRTMPWREE